MLNVCVTALLSSASANGFQMVVNGQQSKALNDFQVVNIQGKLTGYGIEEQLPTIAIVAHYDAYGVAPVSINKVALAASTGFPKFVCYNGQSRQNPAQACKPTNPFVLNVLQRPEQF